MPKVTVLRDKLQQSRLRVKLLRRQLSAAEASEIRQRQRLRAELERRVRRDGERSAYLEGSNG